MKRKLLEKHNKFIALLLSIIGIGGACTFGGCEYGTAAEYGTPSATFKVHGKITSEDNKSIRGIRVIMRNDTAHTDQNGLYNIQTTDFPTDQDFAIKVEDIDAESNGEYQTLDTIVSFVNPVFENPEGSWHSGETEKEMNIELKEKS